MCLSFNQSINLPRKLHNTGNYYVHQYLREEKYGVTPKRKRHVRLRNKFCKLCKKTTTTSRSRAIDYCSTAFAILQAARLAADRLQRATACATAAPMRCATQSPMPERTMASACLTWRKSTQSLLLPTRMPERAMPFLSRIVAAAYRSCVFGWWECTSFGRGKLGERPLFQPCVGSTTFSVSTRLVYISIHYTVRLLYFSCHTVYSR